MTSVGGPGGGSQDEKPAADAPGWALPTPDPNSVPLTEAQLAVVEKVAEAQRALGKEEKWRRAFKWDVILGIFGGVGSVLMRPVDAFLAARAEGKARDAEREAEFLVDLSAPKTVAQSEPKDEFHVLAGGPPTREEVYEAEMHPWPHHGMAETIEHNRELRKNPVDAKPPNDRPNTNAEH